MPRRIGDLRHEMSLGVVCVHGAVAEVADQHITGEGSKACRRHDCSPGSIQGATAGKGSREIACAVEGIHDAQTRAGHRIVFGGILLGIGYKDEVGDHMDSMRSVSGREIGISKATSKICGIEIPVIHFDFAAAEIRRQQESAAIVRDSASPFVNRPRGRIVDSYHRIALSRPVRNDSIFRIEQKGSAVEISSLRVGYRARRATWAAGIHAGAGDSHHQALLVPLRVVQGRGATIVIGDPERVSRDERNSPGIRKLRISVVSHTGCVGDEVGL